MKSIKLITLIVIFFMTNISTLFSQTVIWSEDFESYGYGATQGYGDPPKWHTNTGHFHVITPLTSLPIVIYDKALYTSYSSGPSGDYMYFRTETIDISEYLDVSFSVDAKCWYSIAALGGLPNTVWIYYKIGEYVYNTTNGNQYGNFGSITAYKEGINANNLQIVISVRIQGTARYDFDNIVVKGWRKSSIGDRVWNDLNHDGVQDSDEPGIAGVTVELYHCVNQSLLESTTTNMNGNYKFENLMPGNYYVKFILPENYAFSPQHQNNPSYYPIPRYLMDSDPYPNTGQTACLQCEGWVDLTIDAGMYHTPCSITSVAAGNQTSCNPADNTYSQEIIIYYQYPPSSGSLVVNGQSFPIGTSPRIVTLTGLYADCLPVDVTASFSQKPECALTVAELFTAATDCQPPTIKCPENITVNNESGKWGAVLSYTPPVGTDICPGAITELTAGLCSGAFFPVGITTEEYTVTDISDMTATCSFTITVIDAENPQIICPADITMHNDPGMCGAVVTYTPPVGTDNCPGATTERINGLGSDAFFPVGTTLEEYKVTDAAGNMATCGFNVTVIDNEPPVFTMEKDSMALWPPNHKYHTFTIENFVQSVNDHCDGDIDIEHVIISTVSSDEEENLSGDADGNTTNDIIISLDCDSVTLRSERDETRDGRVYTIHFAVVDNEGNLGEDSSFVFVPLNKSGDPVIDDGPTYVIDGECEHSPAIAEIPESEITHEASKLETISDKYELIQNYPNPFNPVTTIAFDLPQLGYIKLTIYDLFGRQIRKLVNTQQKAGHFQVIWDGTDERNMPVSSGVYFCRMETANFVKVIKLAFVK